MRTPVATYRPGQAFTCAKRTHDPRTDTLSEPCGATIVIHGYHWCAQVCPVCLANYFIGYGADMGLYQDHGFYPADVAARVRATIAANGGQYIPGFSR